MSPFLQLAFALVIILLAAKLAGYLATRLGQPAVLGELVAGVLLGPSLINLLGLTFLKNLSLGETVSELSQIGVLLLMFLAGLELHLGELAKNRKASLLASLGGVLLSVAFGWLIGFLLGMGHTSALLLGIALGATSVSISARTLMELGQLRSRVGLTLLGAAVLDDILSILVFSVFLAITSRNGGAIGLLWTTARMLLFLAGAVGFGLWVLPLLARWVDRLHQADSLRDDLPIMPSLSGFYEPGESLSRTIFSVVREDKLVEKVRLATHQVIGDLNRPDTGLFIVLPVDRADGLDKKQG